MVALGTVSVDHRTAVGSDGTMERIVTTGCTPEEHYAMLEEALTNVLQAGKARVCEEFMDQLFIYERCLRVALGLPVEFDS